MVKASDGKVAANYDYSPYSELLASGGAYASTNPFRFSTKYTDAETGLAYFGYRYYHPDTGRWLNRDPIEEIGGLNLYGYVKNSPILFIDPLGNITDYGVFSEMGKHWFIGGGSPFEREGGEWSEFVKNFEGWENHANGVLKAEAIRLWKLHSIDHKGSYVIMPHSMYINGFWTRYTLNGVRYHISGSYEVRKCERKVIFTNGSHIVTDYADADGKKDILIWIANIVGYNFNLFQFYPVNISWKTEKTVFEFSLNSALKKTSGDWPFK
jgi:RHS repeat-associated protein